MTGIHQHGEIELNVITTGVLTYEFGGEPRSLPARWRPSGACARTDCWNVPPGTTCAWLTVPLPAFLRFGLPATFIASVLGGQMVTSRAAFHAARTCFDHWAADLGG